MSLHRFFQPARVIPEPLTLRLSSIGDTATQSEVNLATVAVNNAREDVRNRRHKTVPNSVKVACIEHCQLYGVSSTRRTFSARYPQYHFSEPSLRRWKKIAAQAETNRDSQNGATPRAMESYFKDKRGRPNVLAKAQLQKVKEIILGSRIAGAALRTDDIISIGHAVLTMNSPHLLVQNGGTLQLTESWAKRIRKNLHLTLRKGTTDKRTSSPKFLNETKLQFQHQIWTKVKRFNIPPSLVINCDQTPLSYVNAGNYTFEAVGARAVPIVGKGDKRMITGTFTVTAVGKFLPMQLIYTGKLIISIFYSTMTIFSVS